jgi:site-specific recombinase XerD
MWQTNIQKAEQHPLLVFAGGGSRVRRSRLNKFCDWQLKTQDKWYLPDLASWRDYLSEKDLTATTVRAYLSTVRAAYRHLLRSNDLRQQIYASFDDDMSPERKLALLTEFVTQLKNAIDPDNSPVKVIDIQDEDDTDHIWLTSSQVAALVLSPGLDTLKGLRDTAMIALILCTGVRAAEALALDVEDLRAQLGGELALRIKSGKGMKQRLVPYGAQDWGLTLVEAWLQRAGLISGPVFVGMRRGDNFYLDSDGQHMRLSERSLEYTLRDYPISINGELCTVAPHDLRRTYARQLYLIGTDLTAIQQNMGHEYQDTTLTYIGVLDAKKRTPQDAYGTTWLKPLWDELLIDPDDNVMAADELPLPQRVSGGYVFKIWLHDIHPQIWRRFKVPAGISFRQLHDIIQIVMGWENYHLYRFAVGYYGFMDDPMGAEDRYSDEAIDIYLKHPEAELFYEYDFGDSWGHILKLEKKLTKHVATPQCMAGNRACPPEDSGGAFMYNQFLHSRKKRKGRVSRKWKELIGNYWDADAFDLKQANEEIAEFWSETTK